MFTASGESSYEGKRVSGRSTPPELISAGLRSGRPPPPIRLCGVFRDRVVSRHGLSVSWEHTLCSRVWYVYANTWGFRVGGWQLIFVSQPRIRSAISSADCCLTFFFLFCKVIKVSVMLRLDLTTALKQGLLS